MQFCAFAAERNQCSNIEQETQRWVVRLSENRFHTRQAAAILLRMARTTSDPEMAARFVQAAADLKEKAGELSAEYSLKPPDVQTYK